MTNTAVGKLLTYKIGDIFTEKVLVLSISDLGSLLSSKQLFWNWFMYVKPILRNLPGFFLNGKQLEFLECCFYLESCGFSTTQVQVSFSNITYSWHFSFTLMHNCMSYVDFNPNIQMFSCKLVQKVPNTNILYIINHQ